MKLAFLALSFALATPVFAKARPEHARVLLRGKAPIVALAYAPDGQTLASADEAHRVTLTDVSSGQTRQSFAYKSAVASLAFAPDGKLLAIGVGKQIRLLDPKSDMKTAVPVRVLEAENSVGGTINFSADGRVLLAVEGDYENGGNYADIKPYVVNLWEVTSGKLIRRYGDRKTDTYAAALSPDGKNFAAFTQGVNLSLFSIKTGEKLRDFSEDFPHNSGFYAHALAFSSNGKWLAGSGGFLESAGNLTVWEVATGKANWNRIFRDWGQSLAWAPDSSRVAAGTSYDTTYDDPDDLHRPTGAPIWNANGKWQRSLQRVPGEINALAWAPNGKTLATGAKDGAVRLWKVG